MTRNYYHQDKVAIILATLVLTIILLVLMVSMTEASSSLQGLVKDPMVGTDADGNKTYDVFYHPDKSVNFKLTSKGTVLFAVLIAYTEFGRKTLKTPANAWFSVWIFEFDLHGKYRTLAWLYLTEKGKKSEGLMAGLAPEWKKIESGTFGEKWEKMCREYVNKYEI